MKYIGLQFSNKSDKVAVIDIEGYIGWDPYDSPDDQIRTKGKMKAELKKITAIKAETIIVNINSYGGDVNHGISIHDLLAEHSAKVITKINGMTASSATIIAMAGTERQMSDNALFLVHNASTWGGGDKNDIKMVLADLETIDGRIANIYSKITSDSKENMLDLMDENNGYGKWLTADEAKDLGFITDVFEPLKAVAYFSNDILKRFQLPPVPDNDKSNITPPDGIAKQIIAEIKDFFNSNNNPNSKNMSKVNFTVLAVAAGLKTLEVADEGIFLSADQAEAVQTLLVENQTAIEDHSALEDGETVEGLRTEITGLKKSNGDLTSSNATLTTENEKLSKKTVTGTGAGSGGDDPPSNPVVDEEAAHFYNLSKIE
ncbi:MAG: Clp protease ClpP [Pseudomonadota bacterium]